MRTVSPGEPILPALTAEWYNHTVKPHHSPPQGRPQPHRHQNEILAKFIPGGGYTEATRFDPVAIAGFIDTNYIERICSVNKSSLNEYNWIIPQATMRDGQLSQPCVYAGLTFANVDIISDHHKFVTLNSDTKTLETADYGKALLLKGNPDGPSLISIETLPISSYLLKTTSTISARSGTTLGSGDCIICIRDGSTIIETAEAITAYNSQNGDPIPSGKYVQAKMWQGVPLIDVVECDE